MNLPPLPLLSSLPLLPQEVQKQASVFVLYAELSFLVPSMFSCPLLVSCSDSLGRKAAILPPLLGNLLFSICCFLISCFSLDLHFLLGAGFVAGLFGGPPALLGGCFAYVADRCREEGGLTGAGAGRGVVVGGGGGGAMQQSSDPGGSPETVVRQGLSRRRTLSMASVDLIWGLIAGLAPACAGVLLYAVGFSWPFLIAFLLYLLNLAYVLLVLQESLVLVMPLAPPCSPSSTASTTSTTSSSSTTSTTSITSPTSTTSASTSSSCCSSLRGCFGLSGQALLGRLQSVYMMFVTGGRRRNAALGLILATFALFKVRPVGLLRLLANALIQLFVIQPFPPPSPPHVIFSD